MGKWPGCSRIRANQRWRAVYGVRSKPPWSARSLGLHVLRSQSGQNRVAACPSTTNWHGRCLRRGEGEAVVQRSVKGLFGIAIRTCDGEIGTIDDVLFEDRWWTIRYLVAKRGEWPRTRRVLVDPMSFGNVVWSIGSLDLKVWSGEIEGAWIGPREAHAIKADPHLMSARHVLGDGIRALDGAFGRVDDLLLNDQSWTVDDLALHTRRWLPSKLVLIPHDNVQGIDAKRGLVQVDLNKDSVRHQKAWKRRCLGDDIHATP